MAFRNNPDMLENALRGYSAQPFEGLETSAVHYAWLAGKALASSGRTAPAKCNSSRGTSVRLETTGGMELLVSFDKMDAVKSIERVT